MKYQCPRLFLHLVVRFANDEREEKSKLGRKNNGALRAVCIRASSFVIIIIINVIIIPDAGFRAPKQRESPLVIEVTLASE